MAEFLELFLYGVFGFTGSKIRKLFGLQAKNDEELLQIVINGAIGFVVWAIILTGLYFVLR